MKYILRFDMTRYILIHRLLRFTLQELFHEASLILGELDRTKDTLVTST